MATQPTHFTNKEIRAMRSRLSIYYVCIAAGVLLAGTPVALGKVESHLSIVAGFACLLLLVVIEVVRSRSLYKRAISIVRVHRPLHRLLMNTENVIDTYKVGNSYIRLEMPDEEVEYFEVYVPNGDEEHCYSIDRSGISDETDHNLTTHDLDVIRWVIEVVRISHGYSESISVRFPAKPQVK